MAYRTNPFLERRAERTTSDQEFARLFSPTILERLPDEIFKGAVHVFRSPPGGGKTTLLRAFTPTALRAFWQSKHVPEMSEAYHRLVASEILTEEGPQLLGVLLSCASGYADLPPASIAQEGLFRALLDCRTVLRALRSLGALLSLAPEQLGDIRLAYDATARDLQSIPLLQSAAELSSWAEQRERSVYAQLDSIGRRDTANLPSDIRFESVIWLHSVQFSFNGRIVAPRRILMIDDLHKLRRKQRTILIEELTELRPSIPVWLAERSIALGDDLLVQGGRENRDLHQYALEDLWAATKGHHHFMAFAQNILDRRLETQSVIPTGAFSQHLREEVQPDEAREKVREGVAALRKELDRYRQNPRYENWVALADQHAATTTLASLRELYVIRILIARDLQKRQLTLDLGPLSTHDLEDRDSSQTQGAADIFISDDLGVPYFFGIDRLCTMATSNVEELLSLAAALFEGLEAKQVLRKPELVLSPQEQHKLLTEVARRKRDFIPKSHTEGTRAQRLLDSIGSYCRERTFLPNAPYAPGVTGIRLSHGELTKLGTDHLMQYGGILRRVLSECVAENLLSARPSAASTSRDGGTVFYLNRTLCAHYGLPLQMGGWQDVIAEDLIEWMERGRPVQQRLLNAR